LHDRGRLVDAVIMTADGYGTTLWEPEERTVREARVTHFLQWLGRGGGYRDLHDWSVADVDGFWQAIWDYFGVLGDRGDGPVVRGERMPDIEWFPGATLNYARNALRTAWTDPDRIAIIHEDESGREGKLSYGELAAEVSRVAGGLRRLGVGKGDRVAALLPNIAEAVIALLATASIGAVWSSCSPDFGERSVVDRFAQIEPTVLIAVDGYRYNGKDYDRRDVLTKVTAALPSLKAVVGVRGASGTIGWEELSGDGMDGKDEFEEVGFEHPLWVVYSSGTTGLPKPIMHSHGGIVLEHLKVLSFHMDLRPGDVFAWFTTTGWMMWNFLVGGLQVGTTIVLYDGSPGHPRTGALWELAAKHRVTYLGVGAPYLLACMRAGVAPENLPALRGVGSTGSPLPPEGFTWVYEAVKHDLVLGSFSGGTDVCTGFVGPSPLLPVRAGIIAGACLGAKVESFDPDGEPLIGQVGELVVTKPMPSMPIGFVNDPDKTRYRESYFAEYPGVWRHGDWIEILPDGGTVIYGRSDATLNRGGVRMGTSEFYRVVEALPEVADSLVVDTGQLGTEGRLVLFVTLAPDTALDEKLVTSIKTALRTQLSPRHVPDEIRDVPGIPRTLSGKKLEVPVRRILLGTPAERAVDSSALANPEVLVYFAPGSTLLLLTGCGARNAR
jgi:acetoacetyl-CoA synthetase